MPYSFQRLAEAFRMEQAQRRLVDGRALQRVDGEALHQHLEPLGDGRLAAAHGAEQIEDLLALFQSLRGMLEERDDLPDHVLHAVELLERWIAPDGPVGKQAGKARVVARIHDLGLADRGEHALGRTGVRHGIALGQVQIFLEESSDSCSLAYCDLKPSTMFCTETSYNTRKSHYDPTCPHCASVPSQYFRIAIQTRDKHFQRSRMLLSPHIGHEAYRGPFN